MTGRPGADTGARPPREVFRSVCVDCICHDDDALQLAAAAHGEENVFFGSDWPFSMGLPNPHEQLAGVEPALRTGNRDRHTRIAPLVQPGQPMQGMPFRHAGYPPSAPGTGGA